MKVRIEQLHISTSMGTIAVPAPCPGPGHGERVLLSWRGVIDRIRYRGVGDTELPYVLHELAELLRHWENRGVVAVEAMASTLSRELVQLPDAGQPESARTEPAQQELAQLKGRDRLEWARSARAARAHNSAVNGRNAKKKADADRRRLLEEDMRRLAVESEQLRAEWEKAFAQRAAIYARARHGFFGRHPGASPALPPYRHAAGLAGAAPAPAANAADGLYLVDGADRVA